ncbi:hypothetical protein Cgig2_019357 [Carnegiea gigantea]|uniref:WRKY domain-containing protein n=1 Tax=Carnegiea gigantea TaxID=171969 RepID=A0A9Q1JLY5_9CARY|nr:hypothetical protein Cgig2_019357 [Carnegiea gigantea]
MQDLLFDNSFTDFLIPFSPRLYYYVLNRLSLNVQAGELEAAKAEMGEVMEENQRLKQYLDQIMKDYQALQMKFYEITQQADSKNPNKANLVTNSSPPPSRAITGDDQDEAELVSLSLGRTSSLDSKKSISNKLNIHTDKLVNKEKEVGNGSKSCNAEGPMERSLDLGLDCKFETSRTTLLDHQQALMPSSSPDNSLDDMRDGEAGEKQTSTALKRSGSGDDEVVQQPPVKKARVSVRVRCDTPTMNDGCQWRKYGQKIAKGNPCPRAYYRCTVAPSCPVRKQVQRCAEDMSILITTYEGTHNHPLPISATAMASTTSAAAYMLMSGSSSSGHQGSNSTTTTTLATTGAELHSGPNFNILPDSSKLKPFSLPNSSSTFLPAPTHPTITLDLTSTPSSSTTQFNRATPSFAPRYPPTNLNFNSSNNPNNNPSISWPNIGLLNYATQPPNDKSQFIPLDFGLSRHPTLQDASSFNLQTFLQKGNPNNPSNPPPMPYTIAQAAKVLTSDPSFQSALTAALSSFISGSNGNVGAGIPGDHSNISDLAQKIKRVGVQTSSNVHSSTSQSTNQGTNNGCGSRLLSMASSATNNSQPNGSLMFLPPPSPLPGSKSTSTSPGDSRDNANELT